jgi:hypothetical protein
LAGVPALLVAFWKMLIPTSLTVWGIITTDFPVMTLPKAKVMTSL